MHVVTWGKVTLPASRVTGRYPASQRRGEWVRSRIAAGEAHRVGGWVALPARYLERGRNRRATRQPLWTAFLSGLGSRAGRDSAANQAHRASVLGPKILGRVGGCLAIGFRESGIFNGCPYFRGEIPCSLMLTVIFQFIRWVFEKFAVGVLIVGLGFAS